MYYEIRRDPHREGPGKWTVWRRQFVRDPWVCIDGECSRRIEAREVVRMWRGRDAVQAWASGITARAWLGLGSEAVEP